MNVDIICLSDKGHKGEREDLSTKVIREIVKKNGYDIREEILLPDDYNLIVMTLNESVSKGVDLILTTGGTGFSKRDITPEATKAVIQREVPGIPEAMRAFSLKITDRAMLSRATAGISEETLIINLPGSPKAVRESLEYIIPTLKHGIEILKGTATDCARKDK